MPPAFLLLLVAILSFVFGWNNGSFLIGNLRGSGTLTVGAAVLVSVLGLLAGAVVEGPKMSSSLAGSLAPTSNAAVMLATAGVSVLLFLLLSVAGRPMSLSMAMVGAFLGATLGAGMAVDAYRTGLVVLFWFLAPVATAVLTYGLYIIARHLAANFSLITVDWLSRSWTPASAILVSYALGSNNIGLLQGTVVAGDPTASADAHALFVVAIGLALLAALGAAIFGRGAVAGTIGDRMMALTPQGVLTLFVSSSVVVWLGTQFALPVSIAQCVLGGMFGVSFAKRLRVLNGPLIYETLLSWLVVPVIAFALAYGIMTF